MAELSDALNAKLHVFRETVKYAADSESGVTVDNLVQAAVELARLASLELGTEFAQLELSAEEDQVLKNALAEHEASLRHSHDFIDDDDYDPLEDDDDWPEDDDYYDDWPEEEEEDS